MENYEDIIIRKATYEDIDDIMNIIKKRCKWLDEQNIEQWIVTRTYNRDYYNEKVKNGVMYVVELEKIVRNLYDC